MSLMNDMLKDLDRRGAGHEHEALGDHHRARSAGSATLWVMVCGVVLLVVVVATLFWWPGVPESSTGAVATEPTVAQPEKWAEGEVGGRDVSTLQPLKKQTVGTSPALDSGSVERALQPPPLSEPTEVAQSEPNSENRERVDTLLESAHEARARDRLTRPVGDNAYEYYQQVLAIAPDEPEALAGLAAIAQRYRELAEAAMDREALAAARQFLQRARSVRPGAQGIQASEARLATLSATAPTPDTAASNLEPAAEPAENESTISVRPDPASLDQRRAGQAERLWSQGNAGQARVLLETTLREWSAERVAPIQSVGVLFDLYLEADELERAHSLLEQNQLPADVSVYRRAQLALAEGQADEALRLLEAGAQSAAEHEAYRALMARLFYEQQRFEEAAAHYRALLTDMGNRPAYWLGLGLAQDARNDAPAALNAFRQALASGAYRDDAAVRDYLQSRVNALTRQTQTQES